MAYEQGVLKATKPSNADLSAKQYFFGTLNSSGKIAVTGDGALAYGVIQNKPAAADRETELVTFGECKVLAGGVIAAGGFVASDANGNAVAAATGEQILGVATEAGVDGRVITIKFAPAGALAA